MIGTNALNFRGTDAARWADRTSHSCATIEEQLFATSLADSERQGGFPYEK